MMSDLTPIETTYDGYKFRSRLEARWAVFFDLLGIKWEYEKEGYKTPFGNYLPDFWLPDVYMRWHKPKGIFLEVKPENYGRTHDALEYVAQNLKCGALLARGFYPPDDDDMMIELYPEWDTPMILQCCPICKSWQFQFPQYWDCPRCKEKEMFPTRQIALDARKPALAYRFW